MSTKFDARSQQRIIGLTGGIATGKTTVARYLASAYQFPILDADIYARKAVEPGAVAYNNIVERYGLEILLSDRTLDRRALGRIVFGNPAERLWLEAEIHPYVRRCLQAELETLVHPVVVAVVPLLFEANMIDLVTEIWVVSCSEAEQVRRLTQRDRLTSKQAKARIVSQMPMAEKITRATVVLDNSTTPEALFRQVDQVLVE